MLTDALDIKRLRAFQLVARNGSLRVAAARLHQTVPAISLKIRRLEDDIGVELFERLPNKMILTGAGKRFLREVDALFDHAERALKELTSPRAVGSLAVSIGSDHSNFFAPRISRYLNKNPGVELSLQVYPPSDAFAGLRRGDLDVALGIFPEVPRGLQKDTIIETTLALLCPVGHPLARRRTPQLRELAAHRLILPPSNAETRKMIDKAFAAASVKPDDMIEVANCGTAKTFVEQHVGLAIVHSLCVSHAPSPKLQWIDLDRYFGRIEFCVVYRQGNHPQSTLLQGLLNEMDNFD